MMPPVFSSSARTGAIPAASMAGLMAFSYTRLKSMFGRPVGSGLLPNGMRTKQSGCGMTTTSVHLSKRQPQYEARALIRSRIKARASYCGCRFERCTLVVVMPQPLCFVLMPFGSKPDPTGRPNIDFNRVYEKAIRPAIEAAGMAPVRADEEKTGGIIHKPMFERLLLCEYAVADLTTANANVFYELGVRHTALPRTTQPIYAKHQPIPFDVNYLRALGYDL